jgi:putative transposase
MALFRNKYRIESARLKDWNYSNAGAYFVTICTGGMEEYFGKVKSGEMIRNPMGEIVAEEWRRTQERRKNVILDEWIIMPNHFHGIIILLGTNRKVVPMTLASNSLGSIIGQFKSIVTTRIHAAGYSVFAWQPRFYDHIIRNGKSLNKIRRYIRNNPLNWEIEKDKPDDYKKCHW